MVVGTGDLDQKTSHDTCGYIWTSVGPATPLGTWDYGTVLSFFFRFVFTYLPMANVFGSTTAIGFDSIVTRSLLRCGTTLSA